MPTDQYHEPPDELGADARTFARLIASFQEEARGDRVVRAAPGSLNEQAEDAVED